YNWNDVLVQVMTAPERTLRFTIKRNDRTFDVRITPEAKQVTPEGETRPTRGGQVGISVRPPTEAEVKIFHHDPLSAAERGYQLTVLELDRTVCYLKDVILGRTKPDQLSGPVGLARKAADVWKIGPLAFINLIAFVSVAVGFVNLLPVPVLDGGHLLFYAIEA